MLRRHSLFQQKVFSMKQPGRRIKRVRFQAKHRPVSLHLLTARPLERAGRQNRNHGRQPARFRFVQRARFRKGPARRDQNLWWVRPIKKAPAPRQRERPLPSYGAPPNSDREGVFSPCQQVQQLPRLFPVVPFFPLGREKSISGKKALRRLLWNGRSAAPRPERESLFSGRVPSDSWTLRVDHSKTPSRFQRAADQRTGASKWISPHRWDPQGPSVPPVQWSFQESGTEVAPPLSTENTVFRSAAGGRILQ